MSRHISSAAHPRSRAREAAGLRVDKWLWCARFFKSRAQATDAVAGGLVHVNGERVKPSRVVHIDDRLADHAR